MERQTDEQQEEINKKIDERLKSLEKALALMNSEQIEISLADQNPREDSANFNLKQENFIQQFKEYHGEENFQYMMTKNDIIQFKNVKNQSNQYEQIEEKPNVKNDWSVLNLKDQIKIRRYLFDQLCGMKFYNHGLQKNLSKVYICVPENNFEFLFIVVWEKKEGKISTCNKLFNTQLGSWKVKIFDYFDKNGKIVGKKIGEHDYILESNELIHGQIETFGWSQGMRNFKGDYSDYRWFVELQSKEENSQLGLDSYTILYILGSDEWRKNAATGFGITFALWIFCVFTIAIQFILLYNYFAWENIWGKMKWMMVFNHQMLSFRICLIIVVGIMQFQRVMQSARKIALISELLFLQQAFEMLTKFKENSMKENINRLTKTLNFSQNQRDKISTIQIVFVSLLNSLNLFFMLSKWICAIAVIMMSSCIIFQADDEDGPLDLIKDFTAILIIAELDTMLVLPWLEMCCNLWDFDYKKLIEDFLASQTIATRKCQSDSVNASKQCFMRNIIKYFRISFSIIFAAFYIFFVMYFIISSSTAYFGEAQEFGITKGCSMYSITLAPKYDDKRIADNEWQEYLVQSCDDVGDGNLSYQQGILENYAYWFMSGEDELKPDCLYGENYEDSSEHCSNGERYWDYGTEKFRDLFVF